MSNRPLVTFMVSQVSLTIVKSKVPATIRFGKSSFEMVTLPLMACPKS